MKLPTQETFAASAASNPTPNQNMRPAEAACYTGLSVSTLAKLRMRHNRSDGPSFLKISGCVVYRRQDLDNWMDSHAVDPST